MLAFTRKQRISDIIKEKKSVTVVELAKKFYVTEETIRRDLKSLEEEGVLIRTYGGAFIQEGVQNDINLSIREVACIDSKRKIARKVKKIISNGDSIFLDSSTTAMFVCKEIKDMRITVTTNSLKIVNLLCDFENIEINLIGGALRRSCMDFASTLSYETLGKYYFDKCFISCRTLSVENGVSDSNEDLAGMRKQILKHSNERYLIADYSKFNKNSFVKICDFRTLQGIVTDFNFDDTWQKALNFAGVKVY